MGFYSFIFASIYKYYSKFENWDPRFSANAIITLSQLMAFTLLMSIIDRMSSFHFFKLFPNKYFVLPVIIIWAVIVFSYYNKNRAEQIIGKFESITNNERKMWTVITILALFLPFFIIFFV